MISIFIKVENGNKSERRPKVGETRLIDFEEKLICLPVFLFFALSQKTQRIRIMEKSRIIDIWISKKSVSFYKMLQAYRGLWNFTILRKICSITKPSNKQLTIKKFYVEHGQKRLRFQKNIPFEIIEKLKTVKTVFFGCVDSESIYKKVGTVKQKRIPNKMSKSLLM